MKKIKEILSNIYLYIHYYINIKNICNHPFCFRKRKVVFVISGSGKNNKDVVKIAFCRKHAKTIQNIFSEYPHIFLELTNLYGHGITKLVKVDLPYSDKKY